MDVKFERTSTIAVARGLLVVRYASSGSERDFPIAVVRPSPQSERAVEIISSPGAPQGWLEKPGDCLVVRVLESSRLDVGVRRSSPSGTLDARFQIDALSGGQAAEPVPETAKTIAEPIKSTLVSSFQEAPAPFKQAPAAPHQGAYAAPAPDAAASRPAISILAHVAMRGDVECAEGQWVAGPNAPAPVEGLFDSKRKCVSSGDRGAGIGCWRAAVDRLDKFRRLRWHARARTAAIGVASKIGRRGRFGVGNSR